MDPTDDLGEGQHGGHLIPDSPAYRIRSSRASAIVFRLRTLLRNRIHAVLADDGRRVGVKVQYPGAGRALISDFNQLGPAPVMPENRKDALLCAIWG
jgi:hypothetical protein